jgi:energy-converting hydrogenase Eha subunit G
MFIGHAVVAWTGIAGLILIPWAAWVDAHRTLADEEP